MDSADSIGVYGEAKAEYTRQLCIFLVPALESYFLDLLTKTKEDEKDTKRVLWVFQDALKQFPDWNMDKVQRETEKIITETKCDYLEEILTAVFIAHTKVLSAIRLTSKQKKLQITIPKLQHFLHRTMSECARLLWSNAYLFAESGSSIDRQKNLRQVEQLLHEGVLQSIRGMLPVKSILKEYLADDGDEISEKSTKEEEPEKEEEAEKQEESPEPVIKEEVKEKETSQEETKSEESQVEETSSEKPKEETTSEEKAPEETPPPLQPVIDLSANVAPTEPITPTIVVDTEPASVGFTQMDTVFDSDNPEKNVIRMSNTEDHDEEVDHLDYDESSPGEDIREYESLEIGDEILAFDEGDFESL